MKNDIAAELGGRSDLLPVIDAAIITAIDHFQSERFWFSESRDAFLFNTSVGQEFYGESTTPVAVVGISQLLAFDYVILYIGSIPWPIARRTDVEIEVLNQNGLMRGQPWNWTYFNEQIRLGPVPDTSYQLRIVGQVNVGAPATDSTLGNPWMTNAERLIRSRAKYEIFLHNFRNLEQAQAMSAYIEDVYGQLKGRGNRLLGRGYMAPMEF
jgi:hypothetical protein